MAESWFEVDADIRVACTPSPRLYGDPGWYARIREQVWMQAWSYLEAVRIDGGSQAIGTSLLGEPLVFTRDEAGAEHLLSNVCTHRGARLLDGTVRVRGLSCPYHGRRFRLDGTCTHSPGFERVGDFPAPRDHLPRLPLAGFGPWRFGALESPAVSAEAWLGPLRQLPVPDLDGLVLHPDGERHHVLEANWALYVENYLEGLHIPFVHPELAKALDPDAYRTELLDVGAVQLGAARPGAPAIEGTDLAGYFLWLFPGTMFNVYPWGVSMNQVEPLGPARTCVHYRVWVYDPERPPPDVDTVEYEDQGRQRRSLPT